MNTERGQVGMLRDEDVAAYLPIMRLAHEKEVVAVMPAVLSKEPGGNSSPATLCIDQIKRLFRTAFYT